MTILIEKGTESSSILQVLELDLRYLYLGLCILCFFPLMLHLYAPFSTKTRLKTMQKLRHIGSIKDL